MLDSHATVDNKNSFKEVITDKIKIAIFKNIILYVKHLQIAQICQLFKLLSGPSYNHS